MRLAVMSLLALSIPASQSQALLDLVVVKRIISGVLGGKVTNNRWTVQVPAGAYLGSGEISIATRSSLTTVCDLSIKPLSKNSFRKPVTLTFQMPPGSDLTGVDIQVYDPVTRVWSDVPGCTQDPVTGKVSAPLWHFSEYRVGGRSGW